MNCVIKGLLIAAIVVVGAITFYSKCWNVLGNFVCFF